MFDPALFGSVFATLLSIPRHPSLGPGIPTAAASPYLQGMTLENAFAGCPVTDRSMAEACLAGLWLYHNHLDDSHRISQSIAGSTGSFWHGILHRREPDAWNSNYWFERVGVHPVYPLLNREAASLARQRGGNLPAAARFLTEQTAWNPRRFIELCETARSGQSDATSLCLQIQDAEWWLLFDYCYRQSR